jgi:type IV secretion system protein VirD4
VYPDSGGDSADWNGAARDLFVGLALYLMETATRERRCTFGEILRQGSGMGKPVREHIEAVRKTPGLSVKCTMALDRFLANHDKVLTSILFTFNTKLTVFSVPSVDAATCASDFDVADVRRRRMSIYVGIPPNRLESAGLLMNLFFSYLIDVNTAVLPEHDPALKYQCLLILDEFTALGRVQIVNKANSFIAGYNLRLLTIIQAISQLEPAELYGKEGARTLAVNHAAKIIYPPTDHEEAKKISDSLDTFTETSISRSRTRGKSQSTGENRSDQKRSLMLPEELKAMPRTQEIVMGFGKPILCEKAFYYDDPLFVDRLREVSPSLAAIKGRLPNEAEFKAAAGSGELATWDEVPFVDLGAWLAAQEDAIAPRQASGEKVIRASDLLAMDEQRVATELADRLRYAMVNDVLELCGMGTSGELAGVLSMVLPAETHGEVVNG